MLAEIFTQWRNNNERVNYPFSDIATLRNSSNVHIDRDLFDDARLYPIGSGSDLYLNKITVTDTDLTFHVADSVNGELASGGFKLADPAPDNIALYDIYGRPAGILVSKAEKTAILPNLYEKGETLFEADQTPFAPTVIVPLPQPGLRGFLLDDGNIVAGDIFLVGVDGVVLSKEDGKIRVDIIGDPYARAEACTEEGFSPPIYCGLRTINGIPPDFTGDWKLSIGSNEPFARKDILRVEQENGIIRIKTAGSLSV